MGGGPRFNYPKYVWSPSGGWWRHAPPNAQRNTVIAFGIAISAMAIMTSYNSMIADKYTWDSTPSGQWKRKGVEPR